jgi:hypothetical protein
MTEDPKEFCVICLADCLKSNMYGELVMKADQPDEEVVLTTGWLIKIHSGSNVLNSTLAGYPENLISLARQLDRERIAMIYHNGRPVGWWAQLEWFGLRICSRHMWAAQDLWAAGGNRHWSK